MILDFHVESSDFEIVDDGCYKYKIYANVDALEESGWNPGDYRIELSYDASIPGALPESYSGVFSYSIQDEDGSTTTKTKTLWINFIPKI